MLVLVKRSFKMKLFRALGFALLLSFGLAGSTLAEPLAAEDAPTQTRAFAEAYNLLLDHYVHQVDTAALLKAAWDNLAKEADSRAVAPGVAPTLSGNRADDLVTMKDALAGYLAKPNSSPDGFVAAHALVRGMVRFVDEGHTYFLDPQQYKDYQAWTRG